MVRRGRPRNPSKARNRVISVVLTELAWYIFHNISLKHPKGKRWIHSFISAKIIQTYSRNPEEKILLQQIEELQDKREKLNKEINIKIRIIKEKLAELESRDLIIKNNKVVFDGIKIKGET